MTFIADPVRMRLDDAGIAVVSKLKNALMVDSADKLLVKSHKYPRRASYCGSGCDESTLCADHCSAGSLPKIAESMSNKVLELFENMPIDREFEKLKEITKQVVDSVRDIAEIADSNDCTTISKASAACFAALDAR
ncbi:hypothetical protein [Burkholderia cepacia]|uniref:hypothetical protein n=2 Tax=Burkholderia cepacia TaxID=292 RepID=UPI000A6112B8|nr:hypothetical protein [Burkholderia cepacia]